MSRSAPVASVVLAAAWLTACGDDSPADTVPDPVGDSVVIAAITPATSTILSPGERIDFAAVVSYTLATADSGRLTLTVRDQQDRNLLPSGTPEEFAVVRGTNRFNVAQSLLVPLSGVTEVRVTLSLFPGASTQTNTIVAVSYQVR
jgi:hypothetical protein